MGTNIIRVKEMDGDIACFNVDQGQQQLTNLDMKRMTGSLDVQYRDLFPNRKTDIDLVTISTIVGDITKSPKDSVVCNYPPTSQVQVLDNNCLLRVNHSLHDTNVVDDDSGEPPFTNIFTSYDPFNSKGTKQTQGRVFRVDKPVQIIVDCSSLKESWIASLSTHSQFYHSSLPPILLLPSSEQYVDDILEPLQQYDDTDEHMQQVD